MYRYKCSMEQVDLFFKRVFDFLDRFAVNIMAGLRYISRKFGTFNLLIVEDELSFYIYIIPFLLQIKYIIFIFLKIKTAIIKVDFSLPLIFNVIIVEIVT